MITNNFSKKIINKEKIKICFVGVLSMDRASDRIFSKTFSYFLNKLDNCESILIDDISEKNTCDIAIFKKNFPIKKLKRIIKIKPNFLVGIINPSDNEKERLNIADFAIVGSVEEKAYYSKYLKCFIYPLIEEINKKYIKGIECRSKKVICYHGNKQHLDFININIENALKRLTKEGYEFKAIYDYKKLGKCKKSFITKHIQWNQDTWLDEISNSTVGICPTTHYTGLLRNKLAKFIARKRILRNDYLLQFKNTSNASRAFIFHQLKIPVVAEIGGSFHHLLGDETAGFLCYSEESWYDSISRLCEDNELNTRFSDKAFRLMKNLYDPIQWSQRFIVDIKYWLLNDTNK